MPPLPTVGPYIAVSVDISVAIPHPEGDINGLYPVVDGPSGDGIHPYIEWAFISRVARTVLGVVADACAIKQENMALMVFINQETAMVHCVDCWAPWANAATARGAGRCHRNREPKEGSAVHPSFSVCTVSSGRRREMRRGLRTLTFIAFAFAGGSYTPCVGPVPLVESIKERVWMRVAECHGSPSGFSAVGVESAKGRKQKQKALGEIRIFKNDYLVHWPASACPTAQLARRPTVIAEGTATTDVADPFKSSRRVVVDWPAATLTLTRGDTSVGSVRVLPIREVNLVKLQQLVQRVCPDSMLVAPPNWLQLSGTSTALPEEIGEEPVEVYVSILGQGAATKPAAISLVRELIDKSTADRVGRLSDEQRTNLARVPYSPYCLAPASPDDAMVLKQMYEETTTSGMRTEIVVGTKKGVEPRISPRFYLCLQRCDGDIVIVPSQFGRNVVGVCRPSRMMRHITLLLESGSPSKRQRNGRAAPSVATIQLLGGDDGGRVSLSLSCGGLVATSDCGALVKTVQHWFDASFPLPLEFGQSIEPSPALMDEMAAKMKKKNTRKRVPPG